MRLQSSTLRRKASSVFTWERVQVSLACQPTLDISEHSPIQWSQRRYGGKVAPRLFLDVVVQPSILFVCCRLASSMSYPLHGPQNMDMYNQQTWTCIVKNIMTLQYYDITHIPREVRDATITFSRCWEMHLGQSVASRFSKSQQLWISGVVREVWPNGSVHVQYEEAQSLCC